MIKLPVKATRLLMSPIWSLSSPFSLLSSALEFTGFDDMSLSSDDNLSLLGLLYLLRCRCSCEATHSSALESRILQLHLQQLLSLQARLLLSLEAKDFIVVLAALEVKITKKENMVSSCNYVRSWDDLPIDGSQVIGESLHLALVCKHTCFASFDLTIRCRFLSGRDDLSGSNSWACHIASVSAVLVVHQVETRDIIAVAWVRG